MSMSNLFICLIIPLLFLSKILTCSCYYPQQSNRKFEQKSAVFWEFEEESNTWVRVKLPYDLVSCVDDQNCTKVGTIDPMNVTVDQRKVKADEQKSGSLGVRRRVSMRKMSETSVWLTGESGSIYERFWNGVQWVTAPHELPPQAGYAVSVFLVNHTLLALSEAGILYQMQLSENSQPIWVRFDPNFNGGTKIRIKSGVLSHDKERIYFCTKNGMVIELSEADPPRWINHGKPPGASVAAIADAASIRPQVIFTISSTGDLYEFDKASKPPWKKHIWSQESAQDTALTPTTGCALQQTTGLHFMSLFLLTQDGNLVERRLHQRKWKWVVHGSPKDHHLTSMTLATLDETHANPPSLFLTTASGSIFEYHVSKQVSCKVK